MNKIMFDLLADIKKGTFSGSKESAQKLYKPCSVIDAEMANLCEEGYILNGCITPKGEEYLTRHEIKNAIILSAGVSSRFVPLCFEKPKGLLKVKGEILIERQIRQLREAGIEDITLVVGFMKEKFAYLQTKYGVSLIETQDYKIRNNHASVWAAREKLGSTIITSSDLYFNKNIFQKYAFDSYYCAVYKEGATDERGIATDAYDKILDTYYGACDAWVTLGYAYFSPRFSQKFIEILSEEFDLPQTINMFWADIQDEHLQELYMYAKRCDADTVYEFDSLEELRMFDNTYLTDSDSPLMSKIAGALHTTENNLSMFAPITKEDLGKGFTFTFEQKKYICKLDGGLEIAGIERYDDKIQELVNITESFSTYYNRTLPLCAAENVISDFGNLPLSMGFQERYIVGNTYSYLEDNNFIGSNYLLPFYEMISEKCSRIFGAKYTDSRTLTGMNCLMIVLMSLSKIGDRIMILGSSSGGHASVKPICERLGLVVEEAPYCYQDFDLDYDTINRKIKDNQLDYLLLAPSDIIFPLDVTRLQLGKTILLYDVSQLMGLIGAKLIANPLETIENVVIFGGTHKTFPGPACGLIMTNNDDIHARLETTINPVYIRHTQMHQKVSLLFTLVEFENYGKAYQEHIVTLAQQLGQELHELGLDAASINGVFSRTHQVFIRTGKEKMDRIFANSVKYGITLNKKSKQLFAGDGIRLGTQEIARYNWPKESMRTIAQIIKMISEEKVDENLLNTLLSGLPEKKIQFTFDKNINAYFNKYL